MERVLSASLGEIILKGKNRSYFEDRLKRQMRRAIKDIGYDSIHLNQGKIYIEAEESKFPQIIGRLKKVFGLVYISPCIRVDKDLDKIREAAILAMEEKIAREDIKTFKVDTNRVDKSFEIKSPELSRKIGGEILKNVDNMKVDVHNPDTYLYIDIREKAYIYTDRYEGAKGMPSGSNGRGMLLLSGGIDSPVAGYMMAKRGIEISAVHYHSYPFTNERAEQKVKDLAKILTRYLGPIRVYSVNILNIQRAINKNCPEGEMTILSRRFMMRIAERIANNKEIGCLVTGENLGQVASQTLEGLTVTNSSVDLPIFRPLIGFDKLDIVNIAKEIETYETSILPFEDCCTVFLPKRPVIKPRLRDIEKSEESLDVEGLIEDAIENMEEYLID